MVDQPVQIGDWQPKNYDGEYRGRVTLRTAFAQSLNSVAAQLAQTVGIDRVIALAKSLGVQSELPAVPSLALGSAEVTLLEMTRAIDAVATNSKSIQPYMVRSIKSQTAAPLLYTRPDTAAERPDWNWAAMMHLLEAVVTEGTGRAARLDRRSAGKTGTTDEYRDAWFIGFTSDIVVGVWIGNDDNSPMDKVAGGEIPAKIWHDFVVEAEKIMAKPTAPVPEPLTGSAKPPPPVPTSTSSVAEERSAPPPAVLKPAALTETAPQAMRGVPRVLDTGTLLLNGSTVRLSGVEGQSGQSVYDLVRYLNGREVACQPVDRGVAQYRCKLGEYDLSEAVVLNGAARAAANAPERLRDAEAQARSAARGIWRQ
jgi:membrane peptidoglycan carboxypeptidase